MTHPCLVILSHKIYDCTKQWFFITRFLDLLLKKNLPCFPTLYESNNTTAEVNYRCIYIHKRPQSEGLPGCFTHRLITARKEVGARLCFYRRLWFCPRGGVPDQVHPPRTRYTPRTSYTPRTRYTPWRSACWEIRSTRGRYAFYWNAF